MQFSKQDLCDKIENAYNRQGHQLGWGLLYTPFHTLHDNSYPIAFMGLNPGGSEVGKSDVSSEEGNSYVIEKWGSHQAGKAPLQQQIKRLFTRLTEEMNWSVSCEELMDRTLCANLVPFRSPDWASLKKKKQALEFSEQLWASVLDVKPRAVYFTISKITHASLLKIFESQGYIQEEGSRQASVGWGNVKYQITHLSKGDRSTVLIRMPHLSTFKIFSREKCDGAIDDMLSEAKKALQKWSDAERDIE